jgi:hypothetical protein
LFQENDEAGEGDGVELVGGLRSGSSRKKNFNSAPKRGVVVLDAVEGEKKKPKLW